MSILIRHKITSSGIPTLPYVNCLVVKLYTHLLCPNSLCTRILSTPLPLSYDITNMSARVSPILTHTPTARHTKGGSQSTVMAQVIVYEGWLLKKRRKKMQGRRMLVLRIDRSYELNGRSGFARRYFTLYQSGLLSYSFEPGKPSRDQLSVPHAAVSTYPGRKDIHIDSVHATFHLKCLSSEDFNKWMIAIRRFLVTDGRKSSTGWSTPRVSYLSRSAGMVEDMGKVCIISMQQSRCVHPRRPLQS